MIENGDFSLSDWCGPAYIGVLDFDWYDRNYRYSTPFKYKSIDGSVAFNLRETTKRIELKDKHLRQYLIELEQREQTCDDYWNIVP